MKYRLAIFALAAVAALAVTPVMSAGPAAADKPACCAGHEGVTRTVTSIADGVKVELSADDPKVAAGLQEKVAKCECKECPLHAEGVSRSVEKTAKGVQITATSKDAATVKKLQEHAAAEGTGGCGHMSAGHKGSCGHAKPASHHSEGGSACEHKSSCCAKGSHAKGAA